MITKAYFDLESSSLPLDQVEKLMPEFEAPGNIKDPEKIKAAIESKKADWMAGNALRAITGQIIAVTVAVGELEPVVYTGRELELISEILKFLRDHIDSGPVYGWNSSGFDLVFLAQRAAAHSVPVFTHLTTRFKGRYYWHENLIDAKQVWSMYSSDHRDTSLAKVALALGVGEKTGNGKDFAELLKTDQQKAIEYCKNDVVLLRKIVQAMGI